MHLWARSASTTTAKIETQRIAGGGLVCNAKARQNTPLTGRCKHNKDRDLYDVIGWDGIMGMNDIRESSPRPPTRKHPIDSL
jgi:hypothetical protein